MAFVETNGCRFYYQQKGRGPDVVLIHAFTSNTAVWLFTNTIGRLARHYRVTAYDLRGHGSSDVTRHGYASDHMAEDFIGIHEALGIGPAVLVGHSYGGVIAMHAAVLQPERIKGIIFSDTYFPGLNHLEPDMGQSEPWADLRKQIQKCDIDIGPTVDFQRLFLEVKGLKLIQKAILAKNMGPVSANWISTMGRLADTEAGTEAFTVSGLNADRIAGIRCPVFALYDEFSPFHKTREHLEKNLAHLESAIVPGAKHLAPLQSTEAFLSLVETGIARMVDGSWGQAGRSS